MTTNFEMLKKDIASIEDDYSEMQNDIDELNAKIVHLRKQGDKLAEALESVLTAAYDSIDEEVQIKGFAALAEWEGDK